LMVSYSLWIVNQVNELYIAGESIRYLTIITLLLGELNSIDSIQGMEDDNLLVCVHRWLLFKSSSSAIHKDVRRIVNNLILKLGKQGSLWNLSFRPSSGSPNVQTWTNPKRVISRSPAWLQTKASFQVLMMIIIYLLRVRDTKVITHFCTSPV
jgi:hypothetical protein